MKRYIKSAIDNSLLISDFMTILKDIYNEKFPHSLCDVWFNSGRYSNASVLIVCYLGKDHSDWAHGIEDNDVFTFRACIDFNGPDNLTEDDYVPNECKLSFIYKSIMTVPEEDWLWCGHHNLKLRSVTGTPEKIIETWTKYVNTLYTETVRLYLEDKLHKNSTEYYDVEEKLRLK